MQRDFASVLNDEIQARQERLQATRGVRCFRAMRFDIPHLNFVDAVAASKQEPNAEPTTTRSPSTMPHDSAPPPCFLTLGLERAGDETAVKRAFRRRALQLHPDRGGSHEGFIALVAAYQQALRLAC